MTIRPHAFLLLLAATAAWGQTDADPPSRVARLSYLSRSVAFRPGTVDEWSTATLNYPITTGDHLWTDAGALAEIHTGLAAIRMTSQTAIAILNLDDRTVQLSITEGTIQIHLRSLEPDETFEVATPNVAVTLLRPGDYRIDVDGDNALTTVTVRGGDAAVTGGGIAFPVHARQTARIRGVETLSEDLGAAIPMDDFERWCESRDRREDQSISAQYVPREMAGYEDLDDYGAWGNDDEYGWVWTPTSLPEAWAPYRYGRWVWIQPWGWTWVDDAPWGFAPFHYGRWAHKRGVWIWAPGRHGHGVRAVYAPALVVFVGGSRYGGSCAWFPLAPGEIYRPGYKVSDRYFRNANLRHVPNVPSANQAGGTSDRYVHYRPGVVTAASNDAFTGARHIGRESARMHSATVPDADWFSGAPRGAQRRESMFAGAVRGAPPIRNSERTVVAKTAPPRATASRVRIASPATERPRHQSIARDESEPRRTERPRPSEQAENDRRQAEDDSRRNERPRREEPRREEPRSEEPRREEPRRDDQPRRARPESTERPRAADFLRNADRPQRVEQPQRGQESRGERPAARPSEAARPAQREAHQPRNEARKNQ